MSNVEHWSEFIGDAEKTKVIEAHLQNPQSTDAWLELKHLDLPLEILQDVTNLERPPSTAWYAFHSGVNHQGKWTHRDMAWGLNVSRPDLYIMQRDMIALIMDCRRKANERGKSLGESVLVLIRDLSGQMDRAYSRTARRVQAATVPPHWYLDAQNTLIGFCIDDAEIMLDRGLYDKNSSQLTALGEKTWAELHQRSMSTEEILSSTFAVIRDDQDSTSTQTCTPCINGIPRELFDKIVDDALPTRDLDSKLPEWTITSRKFLESSIGSYSRNKAAVIKAKNWPTEGFSGMDLPLEWLQKIETVYFDYDGVRFSDRFDPHPVIKQLASIWKVKNRLKSITIPIPPSQESLLAPEPRIQPCEGIELPFAPLRELDKIKIEYVYDFGAPVVVAGMNSLCYISYRSSESFKPYALPFLLERSKAYINKKSSDYTDNARTPVHYALKKHDTGNLKLLLDVEGADVNSKDSRGLTPIEAACKKGWNEPAWVLVHNTKVKVTKSAVRWAEDNKMWPEIIRCLYRRI